MVLEKSQLIYLVLTLLLIFPLIPKTNSITENEKWNFQTITKNGTNPSLALDKAGNPHISYVHYLDQKSVLRYSVLTGSNWVTQTVDDYGYGYSSLALDLAGNPYIAYIRSNNTQYTLEYANWTGLKWVLQDIDQRVNLNSKISLLFDPLGNPCIGYSITENGTLKVVYASLGSQVKIQVIDEGCFMGLYLNSNGIPSIIYIDKENTVKFASLAKDGWKIQIVDSTKNYIVPDSSGRSLYNSYYNFWDGSLFLDSKDVPTVFYSLVLTDDYSTKVFTRFSYFKSATLDGTNWIVQTVNYEQETVSDISPNINLLGNLAVAYSVGTTEPGIGGFYSLKYANWNGANWKTQSVTQENIKPQGISLALDIQGNPRISYSSNVDNSLKYAYFGLPKETIAPLESPSQMANNPHTISNNAAIAVITVILATTVIALLLLRRIKRK
jgi:hypothetical protein